MSRAAIVLLLLPATLLLAGVDVASGAPKKHSAADDPKARAQNLLRVASLLVRDGHLDRAAAVLREIDIKTKGLDRARYHTLSGLVALKRRDYRVA
ncbi:MAG: hypothetical protein KC503_39285, partial [Myxococcales bacterium]|nr:hypothetical protein [Myxococcales bacterium]